MHILRLRGQGLWLLRVLARTHSLHGQPKPLLLAINVQGQLMAWAVSLACLGHQREGLISQAVISTSAYSPGDSPISKCGLTFTLKRPGSIFLS